MSLEAKGKERALLAARVMGIFIALGSSLNIWEGTERAREVNKAISKMVGRKVMVDGESCVVRSGSL